MFFGEGGSTFLGVVMDGLLPRSVVDSIRRTAKELKGFARRVFQAVVTNEHAEGKPRKAETLFGWNRDAVKRGIFEKSWTVESLEPVSISTATSIGHVQDCLQHRICLCKRFQSTIACALGNAIGSKSRSRWHPIERVSRNARFRDRPGRRVAHANSAKPIEEL